jgi:hypothetical protein
MRKLLPVLLLLLVSTQSVSAHGGPPFILVNGQLTSANTVFSGSTFFKIANEIADQKFLVGQKVDFTIDTNLAPVDPSLIEQSTFTWEFGDGNKMDGIKSNHSYTKTGSYIVILKVKDPSTPEPVEIESIQINVVPDANYTLPEAVVKVNGEEKKDALKEPTLVSKGDKVVLEGTNSKGKIRTFKWDLGDGSELVEGEKVEYTFDFSAPYTYSFFPILRVEDENGLTSDTLVQISNKEALGESSQDSKENNKTNFLGLGLLGLGGLGILVAGIAVRQLAKSKKTKP